MRSTLSGVAQTLRQSIACVRSQFQPRGRQHLSQLRASLEVSQALAFAKLTRLQASVTRSS